ncbi:uncharacterized protein LOC131671748 [Phymastichus coffea]|uniref:uncharacterized protein LOC131671748 n=1 Tax=Phymastichus coffea TaxID=108790 RepID=UPI00273C8F0D|nr:uncharacterized protein LOC131671748 [Phymastichus coffea]
MAVRRVFVFAAICVLTELTPGSQGTQRCVKCRSRGELGSCKDPFTMNVTQIESEHGVEVQPCVSHWCAKSTEARSINNEYGTATERWCLQRGPEDGEERCAYTKWNGKKIFMCMCQGDLCNTTSSLAIVSALLVISPAYALRWL